MKEQVRSSALGLQLRSRFKIWRGAVSAQIKLSLISSRLTSEQVRVVSDCQALLQVQFTSGVHRVGASVSHLGQIID
jgi:hypothetical protein